MGIVLTVLEPPHPPEPNLVAALPPGAGLVIDVEPRLVSPRYDKLIVTTRGLLVRNHVTGDFHGVPWANFSVDAHLRQHSRHATLLLWLNERRPMELAVTRRVALNIASVAPVLKRNPTAAVDDIVIVDPPPDVVDLRDRTGHATVRAPSFPAAPLPADRVDGLPPPNVMLHGPPTTASAADPTRGIGPDAVPATTNIRPSHHAWSRASSVLRRQSRRLIAGLAVLAVVGAAGGVAAIAVNGDDPPADGSPPTISSEAVEPGQVD